MKFIVEIKCDNAAFEEVPNHEVQRILREVVKSLQCGRLSAVDTQSSTRLIDFNGNRVGEARWETE